MVEKKRNDFVCEQFAMTGSFRGLMFAINEDCKTALMLLIIHDWRIDLHRRYGVLCKEEGLWNVPVISVFSREYIEAILKRSSRYPLRPPQEVISYYRRTRSDRYTNLGLVNEYVISLFLHSLSPSLASFVPPTNMKETQTIFTHFYRLPFFIQFEMFFFYFGVVFSSRLNKRSDEKYWKERKKKDENHFLIATVSFRVRY